MIAIAIAVIALIIALFGLMVAVSLFCVAAKNQKDMLDLIHLQDQRIAALWGRKREGEYNG